MTGEQIVRDIRRAFRALEGQTADRVIFEHDQFWVVQRDGAQYAVQKGTGPGTRNGFAFEQVKEAEEGTP